MGLLNESKLIGCHVSNHKSSLIHPNFSLWMLVHFGDFEIFMVPCKKPPWQRFHQLKYY